MLAVLAPLSPTQIIDKARSVQLATDCWAGMKHSHSSRTRSNALSDPSQLTWDWILYMYYIHNGIINQVAHWTSTNLITAPSVRYSRSSLLYTYNFLHLVKTGITLYTVEVWHLVFFYYACKYHIYRYMCCTSTKYTITEISVNSDWNLTYFLALKKAKLFYCANCKPQNFLQSSMEHLNSGTHWPYR